ncbi:MAG: phospholipase D family protein [Rhodoferax sp.]|nr:phospholipase D family protein [Rhodoferax sp.]
MKPRNKPLSSCSRCVCSALALIILALMVGCSTTRQEVPRPNSYASERPQETELAKAFAAQLGVAPGLSGFRLLPDGQEALLVRAALADAAQRTLDLQYHIIAPDATGTLLIYHAMRAAQRGVRVRLLIDDLDVGDRDSQLATLAAHPNFEVRVFNPFARRSFGSLSRFIDYLSDGTRLNRRMHNKLWIADNSAALIGGRNLGDAYFNADGRSNFADLDVLSVGPVVAQASQSFDEYWNSEWSVPIQAYAVQTPSVEQVEQLRKAFASRADEFRQSAYAQALRASDLGSLVRSGRLALVAANATVLYDHPGKLQGSAPAPQAHVMSNLRDAIASTQRELALVSPYFVPQERGVDVLCGLTRRGVRVRILTNSLASTDVAAVHAAYARYRPQLLACGVDLHELRPSETKRASLRQVISSGVSLHAKAILLDGKVLLIGSMNLDPRSRLSNTEVAVLIDSAVIGKELGRWLDEATSLDRSFRLALAEPGNPASPLVWHGQEDDKPVRYTRDPLASWWQRATSTLLGVVIPEDML